MADEPEDDVIDVQDVDAHQIDQDEPEQEAPDPQDPPIDDDQGSDDDVEYAFGDAVETARGDDSGLVKKLRAEIKERDKRLAELQQAQPQEPEIEVGEEPNIDDYWDKPDEYKADLRAYDDRKNKAEARKSEQRQRVESEAKEAEKIVQGYGKQKEALAKPDYDEAETAVFQKLGGVKASLLIQGADNAALVVHALSRFPDKLDELAAIANPTKFAFAAAKLEGQLKAMPRRKTPEPEEIARGSGRSSHSDKELERLERDADKTGDRSKLVAYKNRMKG